MSVTATSTCGGSTLEVNNPFTSGTNCSSGLRVAISPNPAQNQLKLNVNDDDTENSSSNVDNSYQVTIFDNAGNIKYNNKFTNPDNQINISSLNAGTYSLRVIKGQGVVTKTFSVVH